MTPGGWKRHFRLGHTRERVREEVDDELRFHLESLADRYEANGMGREEALAKARAGLRRTGARGVDLEASAWRAHRRARRRACADGLRQDLRLTLRRIRIQPGFSILVVLTLGLGLGANSAIFSVFRSVVLEPLPFSDPGALTTVWTPTEGSQFNPLSAPDWMDLRTESQSFQSWGVYQPGAFNLSGDAEPEQVDGISATGGLLRALDVTAARGRLFLPEETEDPVAQVAVVSHALWQGRFGGDPNLLGKEILVDQGPRTIIGILPEEFRFPDWGSLSSPDILVPLPLNLTTSERGAYYLRVIGRLADGVSAEAASEELNTIAARLAELYPETNSRRIVTLFPLRDVVVGSVSGQLWILMGVAGFVLLLACVNVGGLLLARNLSRGVEMAVRASLGAGRGRLIRQLLTETLVLAGVGGGLGLLLARWGTGLSAQVLPLGLLGGTRIEVDGMVIQVTLGLTLLTSVLAGLIPAFAASSLRSGQNLRKDSSQVASVRSRARLLSFMVVFQLALTFILVDGAGLMVQSLRRATGDRELDEPERVLVAGYTHPQERGDEIVLPDPFLERFLERVRALPGVAHAGATTTLPLRGAWSANLLPEGQEYDPDRDPPLTYMNPVSPDYFEAMGIALLRGRDLTLDDASAEVVGVVVNQAFASRSWPGEDPIGKRIRDYGPTDPWFQAQVMGVVEDVRQNGLEAAPQAGIYLPFFPPFSPNRWVAVRTEGDPSTLSPSLRRILAELDPHRPITRVFTADYLYSSMARGRSATTRLFGLFALVAISLAAAGTFGVMSFFVGRKTREMGIRVALGARRAEVVWLVLRTGMLLSLMGAGIGFLGVWGVSGVFQNLLFGVRAMNPGLMALTAVFLMAVALLATLLPALRAGGTDPVEVMSAE